MKNQLTKSTAHIQEALNKAGLECEVLELPTSTRTASEASASIGCNIAQIVKSIIFQTKDTGKPILVLASGANQVNVRQIESYVGEG